jgi:hypothetical protein
MKIFVSALVCFILFNSCNQRTTEQQALKQQVDSLQLQIKKSYKPGLGEFMLGIQMHHAKLWFAGKAENWKLANFEIEEIEEAIGDIQQFCTDRPEVKSIGMISPPIDSIKEAIETKNEALFTGSFALLTNTCNNCHVATQHEFNVIKIPDVPPVSNQKFGL